MGGTVRASVVDRVAAMERGIKERGKGAVMGLHTSSASSLGLRIAAWRTATTTYGLPRPLAHEMIPPRAPYVRRIIVARERIIPMSISGWARHALLHAAGVGNKVARASMIRGGVAPPIRGVGERVLCVTISSQASFADKARVSKKSPDCCAIVSLMSRQ